MRLCMIYLSLPTMTKPGAKQMDSRWDILIESFLSFFSLLPHEMLIVGQLYTSTSLVEKNCSSLYSCTGPSYTVLNLLLMWNSIRAWFSEGRTPATHPVLPYVYHTSVVICRVGWSLYVGSLGSRSCWGPKGAGKQCVGEYCEHEKKQCDLHDTVDMFLVRRRRLA